METLTQFFEPLLIHPVYFPIFALITGLIVGSFVNVVIYRLPRIIERDLNDQCRFFLKNEADESSAQPAFNLAVPKSHCPHCNTPVKLWHNLPLISFIMLKGRCAQCAHPISWQYPLVEALTGFLFMLAAMDSGGSEQTLFAWIFICAMIALTVIDLREQILPDNITLPLIWLGLIVNVSGLFTGLSSAVYGAVAGYLVLWLVFWIFYLVTGKEGMGFGDFKLTAALGAWFGWQVLPVILLIASSLGSLVGLYLIFRGSHKKSQPIPFGPYLAFAGVLMLLCDQWIFSIYTGLIL